MNNHIISRHWSRLTNVWVLIRGRWFTPTQPRDMCLTRTPHHCHLPTRPLPPQRQRPTAETSHPPHLIAHSDHWIRREPLRHSRTHSSVVEARHRTRMFFRPRSHDIAVANYRPLVVETCARDNAQGPHRRVGGRRPIHAHVRRRWIAASRRRIYAVVPGSRFCLIVTQSAGGLGYCSGQNGVTTDGLTLDVLGLRRVGVWSCSLAR